MNGPILWGTNRNARFLRDTVLSVYQARVPVAFLVAQRSLPHSDHHYVQCVQGPLCLHFNAFSNLLSSVFQRSLT